MDQPSHIQPSQPLRRSRRYGAAGTDEHEVGAIDRNRPGGSGEPPLPASRRGLALRRGGCTLAKQRDPESIRGFTLVELLIAAAITVVIVVMLGLMLGSLVSSASHASQRVDAFRDARAALQMMERDLSNLVRAQWNPATTQPVTRAAAYFALDKRWQDAANDPYSDPANGNPNRQMFGLIATKSSAPGDMCAVGYYCRWDTQLHAYTLRRLFLDATTTFNVFTSPAVTAANYASDSDLYAPSVNDEVLAAYVWNLNITMRDAAGNVINTYPYICDPNTVTPTSLPAAIEISFNAMSPQAARTVTSVSSAPADWMDTTTQNYQRLVRPHAYEFRTRINLQ
jgi:type II secretory pathway pseudopilin PulG